MYELVFTIVIIVISLGTYYYYQYREYTKREEALKKSKITPQCPDYWKSIGNNKCENIKSRKKVILFKVFFLRGGEIFFLKKVN